MKISSNFQEYYDSMRATDEDPDPLYVRLSKYYWLSLNNQPDDIKKYIVGSQQDENHSRAIRGYRIHFNGLAGEYTARWLYAGRGPTIPDWFQRRVIGFCGRVYPVVSVGSGKNWKHAYNPERARRLVQEYNPEVPQDHNIRDFRETIKKEKQPLLAAMDRPFRPNYHQYQFQEWGNLHNGVNDQIGDEPFRHFRAPVLMAEMSRMGEIPILITNPQLKNFDFVQMFTPQQAYQELSMYIGNNLAGLDRIEPRPITDKLRSETKGFDKWSFKNQKNRKVSDRGDW